MKVVVQRQRGLSPPPSGWQAYVTDLGVRDLIDTGPTVSIGRIYCENNGNEGDLVPLLQFYCK